MTSTDDGSSSGVSSIISALPEVGSILASILGAAHRQAVAAEAGNLNQAVPIYQHNLVAIIGAFNGGQIPASVAMQAVDEAVHEYYQAVAPIIKDSSNSGASCTAADANGQGTNCNGPCTVGCAWIVPWANRIKVALQQGNANLSFEAIVSHAGFNGLPAWSITIAAPSILNSVGLNISAPESSASLLPQGTRVADILSAVSAPTVSATHASIAAAQPLGSKQSPLLLAGFVALGLLGFFVVSGQKK